MDKQMRMKELEDLYILISKSLFSCESEEAESMLQTIAKPWNDLRAEED